MNVRFSLVTPGSWLDNNRNVIYINTFYVTAQDSFQNIMKP